MLAEMTECSANWANTPTTGVFGAELCGARARDGVDPAWLSTLLEDHRFAARIRSGSGVPTTRTATMRCGTR